jgi:hypothetical protein
MGVFLSISVYCIQYDMQVVYRIVFQERRVRMPLYIFITENESDDSISHSMTVAILYSSVVKSLSLIIIITYRILCRYDSVGTYSLGAVFIYPPR